MYLYGTMLSKSPTQTLDINLVDSIGGCRLLRWTQSQHRASLDPSLRRVRDSERQSSKPHSRRPKLPLLPLFSSQIPPSDNSQLFRTIFLSFRRNPSSVLSDRVTGSSRAGGADDEPNEYSILNLDLDKFTSEEEASHLFQMWKKEMKREYQTQEEESQRFQVFKSNLKYIKEKNAKRESPNDCKLGLNQFSDMSYEEFSKTYLHETDAPPS